MRFLSVSLGWHPDIVGGAWRVAAEQAAHLARRGHEVEAITAHPGGGLPSTEIRNGVTIYRYPQKSGGFFANWRAANRAAAGLLGQRLATGAAPVLILQHHAYLEPAMAEAVPGQVPILHTFHGPWAEEYRFATRARRAGLFRRLLDAAIPSLLRRVEHTALRRARRILVLSRHFALQLPRWHPGALPPVEVAPGGVDFDQFQPAADRTAMRASWGIHGDEFLFVALRRLDARMGLDLLIEAFARLAPAFPRARLWLTGRGPAEASLREQIARLRLGGSARLLGFLEERDLPRLLNAADVAVMPSLDLEGFGLATAEALACGTPVLGSRAGATPELIEPLDAGLLFEPGSVDALVDRLRAAISRSDQLPSRDRCAAFARERFSWRTQIEACERAAGEWLGTPQPA